MRTYEETHPWLRFSVDWSQASPELWALMGACQAKSNHIAYTPLKPAVAKALHGVFLAKGVLATTAIEGNTLSEEEVLQHLEGKLDLPPSRRYLAVEVDNVIAACKHVWRSVAGGGAVQMSASWIMELNALVLKDLKLNADVEPGAIRRHSVAVGLYRGAPAEDCDGLLEKLCSWLNEPWLTEMSDLPIMEAILKAVIAHLYLAWIHPFADGNGRTARLVEFHLLTAAGVPSPTAHLLSNHYNQTRIEYYRQLERSSISGGDVFPFLLYAVQGFRDGLVEQLERIRTYVMCICWRDFVFESFRGKNSAAQIRRRQLVLDLSEQETPVSIADIPDISTRMARYYAKCTQKTLTRDVNALIDMELVSKTPAGIRAVREKILAFLPPRATV